jgi:hypothetical protein
LAKFSPKFQVDKRHHASLQLDNGNNWSPFLLPSPQEQALADFSNHTQSGKWRGRNPAIPVVKFHIFFRLT